MNIKKIKEIIISLFQAEAKPKLEKRLVAYSMLLAAFSIHKIEKDTKPALTNLCRLCLVIVSSQAESRNTST